MTVSEVSRGESVLKSSVEIMARESAEANILKLGRMLRCMKRQREISTGGFCELCTLTEPEGSAHTAEEEWHTHIVGIHRSTCGSLAHL